MITSPLLSRTLPILLLTGCLAGGAWYLDHRGYTRGYDVAAGEGNTKLETLKREQAEVLTKQEREARERLESLASRLQTNQHAINEMASDLAEQQRLHRDTTDQLTGEIHRVTNLYRRAQDAAPEPVPQCVFTRGWVRLYDSATGAYPDPVPATGHTPGAAARAAITDPTWQLDSAVSQAELLGHHLRYAEQCRNTAAQLSGLIRAVQQQRR